MSETHDQPKTGLTGRTTVRDAVMDVLRQCGMTTVYGNPGSTELPMFRDFPADFRYVLALQESVAVAMADGHAQITRNATVVNLHSAGGVGHALGSVFTAFRNKAPMVIIAGQQARSILPHDPYLYAEDATSFPKPYVKYSVEPARAEDVPAAIARAYYMAMQAPCGPTFVSVPVDDWDREADPVQVRRIISSLRPHPDEIQALADALAAAERPALIMGAEVDRDGAWSMGVELAERHNARVFGAPHTNRSNFPEDHPLFAGYLPPSRERIVQQLAGQDLVVALGTQIFPFHIEGQGPFLPDGAQLFQLTEDPVAAASAAIGTSIRCSMKLAIADLLSHPARPQRPAPAGRKRTPAVEPSEPMTDAFALQTIARLRPKDSIYVHEAPGSSQMRQAHVPITCPDGLFLTGSGSLGYGLAAAVGIALGESKRKVLAVIGDGSAMYSIQALYSAAEQDLPITFVILNNRRYEALQSFAAHFGLPRDIVGTDLRALDFAAIARGQGCQGLTVSSPSELEAVLTQALRAKGPVVVDVLLA